MPWLLPVTRRLIPFYNEQRHLMLSLISFERETSLRVLDLGCAPGLLAVDLLAAFPRVTLTVFDLTAEMIEACRDSLRENERVTYRVGDFRIAELGNGHDLILASLSLHHLELSERAGFFRRAYQSLNPGGHLIAAEVIVDESPAVRAQQYQLWRNVMRAQGEDADAW